MRFDVFSLFPEVFQPYLEISILKRAIQAGLIEVNTYNIRDWATDRHHTTDDTPYGGGGGMIMKPEPIFAAVEAIEGKPPTCPVILLSPQGQVFNQQLAFELAGYERLALICGRYEGFDERIREHLATHVLSIGDYILTGGELPALIVMDAIARLQPGVLGDENAPLMILSLTASWSIRNTRARQNSAAGRCQRCSCRATMRSKPNGNASSRSSARCFPAQICC